MMLRTTISRIKKVCTGAFIPRVLRGERCAPVSYAVIRTAPLSTKVPNDGEQATTDVQKEDGNFVLASSEELKIEDKKRRPLTHHERCQKIIEQAFGKESTDDSGLATNEQYCSHTLNIEETKREIIESEKAAIKMKETAILIEDPVLPDDRSHYSIFETSREYIDDDDNDNVLKETTLVKPVRESNLGRCLVNMERTDEDLKLLKDAKVERNINKQVNNQQNEEQRKALGNIGTNTTEIIINDIYPSRREKPGRIEDTVKATTVKEVEEEFTQQKLENIEETPLVEAQKPTKIEGFNVTPKVLEDLRPTYTFSSDENIDNQTEDFSNAVDEVAKRCMRSPEDKIDEMLINELENLEIRTACNTEIKSPSIDMEEDLVRMDVLKKQSTSPKPNDDPINMFQTTMPQVRNIKTISPVLDEQTEKVIDDEINKIDPLSSEESPEKTSAKVINPYTNQVLSLESPNIAPKSQMSNKAWGEQLTFGRPLRQRTSYKGMSAQFMRNLRNSQELPESTEHVIDEIRPITLHNPNFHEIVYKHNSEPLLEGNDANDLSTEQNKSENIHQVHTKAAAAKEELSSPPVASFESSNVPGSLRSSNNSWDPQCSPANNYNQWAFFKGHNSPYVGQHHALQEASKNSITSRQLNFTKEHNNQQSSENRHDEHSNDFEGSTNTFFTKVPFRDFRLPSSKWNVNIIKPGDKATPRFSDEIQLENTILVEDSQHPKAILPNEILKQSDLTCLASPRSELTHEKTDLVNPTLNIENSQADRDLINEKLKQHELDLNAYLGVNTYAYKKGIELVDDMENKEDCQAKRSLDYDPIMESEKFKQNKLNLISNDTCPDFRNDCTDFTCALRDTSVMEDPETKNIEPELNSNETCTISPRPVSFSNTSYANEKGINLLDAIKDNEDIQVKRSWDCDPETVATDKPTLESTLKLSEDVALSELLRRVRVKNRLMAFNRDYKTFATKVDPVVGKCGRKAPRCPPTAPRSPPSNPVPPPSFGLPMLKRRPPYCKPRRKPKSTNCSACDLPMICSLHLGSPAPQDLGVVYGGTEEELSGLFVHSSQVELTELVIDRLQNLGRTLTGVLCQVKSQVETMFSRDYEPWVPIPSWPLEKKIEKAKR